MVIVSERRLTQLTAVSFGPQGDIHETTKTKMDARPRPHSEITGTQQDTRRKDCSLFETNGGRNTAEGL